MKKYLVIVSLIVTGYFLLNNGAAAGFQPDTNILPAVTAETIENNPVETRCGWFSNPTPGNAWINDKQGEWIVGAQGGHQADGDWPDFSDSQWVKTNGNYGYGCACLTGTFNAGTHEVIKITKATARPLSVCKKDKTLKRPS